MIFGHGKCAGFFEGNSQNQIVLVLINESPSLIMNALHTRQYRVIYATSKMQNETLDRYCIINLRMPFVCTNSAVCGAARGHSASAYISPAIRLHHREHIIL